ncbi:family 78 glycoside hydrolase catalytic domain [Pedobacter alpinus]|uniref:alpha-L-rhamnosidase n=1 Tax=Pedobacter alpinus TaxID=1590643 RepID=A0ABW5TPY2_9SPHI
MKRILFLLLLLHCCAAIFAQQLEVHDLNVEYKINPSELDAVHPNFSWIIKSTVRNTKQTAFQLLVSKDLKSLKKNFGTVWDSKWVSTSNSTHVKYNGQDLASATKYFWKVRVKDNRNQASAWSVPAEFITGILKPEDWHQAWWITDERLDYKLKNPLPIDGEKDKISLNNQLPLFRKSFNIDKKVKHAYAFVAGLGHFEFSVNGTKIGDHFLDAGWTKYNKEAQYVGFDITAQLKKGKNALGVMLGNGFYFIPPVKGRYRKTKNMFDFPKMICLVKIEYADGSMAFIKSDETWKTSKGPITFSSIYGGEDYDATLEQKNWNKVNFDDANWKNILITDGPPKLIAQQQEPLKVFETFEAKKIAEISKQKTAYDLGQNFSGIISITVKGSAGDTIRVYPAELINTDFTANQKSSGKPYYFQYILKGNVVEEWQPRFSYYGFRYLEVQNLAINSGNQAQIIELKGLHTRNSAAKTGSFTCSNPLYNQTYDLIDWAIKSNMASVLTDCPHREKLGWLEQVHLMGSSINANYQIASLLNKAMADMRASQTEEGLVPEIAPEYVFFNWGGDIFRDSPEWGSSSIIVPWYAYQWYGNEGVLYENYPMMVKYLDYIQSQSTDFINEKGLSDWYDLGPKASGVSQLTPKGVTATAIWYYDLTLMIKIAKQIGKTADMEKYQALAEKVKKAFNDKFFHTNTKQYATGSQTANAMAIFMGLVNQKDKSAVIENLIKDIESRNNSLTAGDIGFRYVLRVLEDAGRSDIIDKMNNRSDVPGYGYQIATGATALTESWAALRENSNNHLMLGHLMEWFYSGLCGIKQAENSVAYQNIIINPQTVASVNQAKAEFKSPYGFIKSSWSKFENDFTMDVEIPVNCDAAVFLPEGKAKMDGQAINNNKNGIRIGSGVYHFSVITN